MNPDRHRAAQLRTQALRDQVEGLELWVADGRTESHITARLADSRTDLAYLEAQPDRPA